MRKGVRRKYYASDFGKAFESFIKGKSDQYLTLLKFSVGTAGIILQAPTLYDDRPAIDELLSEIEAAIYTKPQDFNGPPGLYDIV